MRASSVLNYPTRENEGGDAYEIASHLQVPDDWRPSQRKANLCGPPLGQRPAISRQPTRTGKVAMHICYMTSLAATDCSDFISSRYEGWDRVMQAHQMVFLL